MVFRSEKTCDFVSKFNFFASIGFPKSIHKGGKTDGVPILAIQKGNLETDQFKMKIERLRFDGFWYS